MKYYINGNLISEFDFNDLIRTLDNAGVGYHEVNTPHYKEILLWVRVTREL